MPAKRDQGHFVPADQSDATSVRSFVRSPFDVRCNVVKVWRPLPKDLWTGLCESQDRVIATRVERQSLIGVWLMASLLMMVISGIYFQPDTDSSMVSYPLIGKSFHAVDDELINSGWHYTWHSFHWHSISLAFWVVAPSLAGWAFFRLICIPLTTCRQSSGQSALTLARHLGAVYLYVYVMVIAGVALMIPLILLAPEKTEWFRWYFWCFLFGETFFVPAAMWIRLVIHDRQGQVFSRFRWMWLSLYLILTVVVPICGMVQELD